VIKKVRQLIFSETGRDTSIVFAGTFINAAAGGLFFILAPRILGPSHFGLFSTVVATGILATSVANLGIDTGILRFAKNESHANEVFSVALKSYIILGAVVAILGFFFSSPIAFFLGQPQMVHYLRIAFFFTVFLLLTNFYVAALQAKREFTKASIVNISSNVARILLLIVSTTFFTTGLYSVTFLFFSVTIVSVIFGRLMLRFKYYQKTDLKFGTFFKYNAWIALSLILSSIPFDNYFLLKISGPEQTGLFAAPFKILTFGYQFGGNFSRVLASRFSSFDTDLKAKSFSIKTIGYIGLLILAMLAVIAISRPLVVLFFGPGYEGSIPVMQILAVGFMFFFAGTIPSSLILYYFGKSGVSFALTISRYAVFIILLIILVPIKNALGAAYAFTISEGVAFSSMALYVFIKFHKNNAN